jgi:hypothetical protein
MLRDEMVDVREHSLFNAKTVVCADPSIGIVQLVDTRLPVREIVNRLPHLGTADDLRRDDRPTTSLVGQRLSFKASESVLPRLAHVLGEGRPW